VKLATGSGAAPAFDARVESSNYYGAMTRLRLDVNGEQLLMEAHLPGSRRPVAGDEIRIEIDPSGIRLIPEE